MQYRLFDLAQVIRSKNSGPFELTLDIIFKDRDIYNKVRTSQSFTLERIAGLYHVPPDSIISIIDFEPAKAIKVNMRRPVPSGNLGDTDVYGAQQHAPLLDYQLEI